MGRTGKILIGCGIAVVLVLAALLDLAYAFGPWAQDISEMPFHRADDERIVSAIRSGTLRPDMRGMVVLPSAWRSMTKDGRVYITHGAHGQTLILFPTFLAGEWFSTFSNFGGDLYAVHPLTGLTGGVETDGITLQAPVLAEPCWTAHGHWATGTADAFIENRIDAHWYAVGTDND